MTLFCKGADADKAKWEGARYGAYKPLSKVHINGNTFSTSFEDAASIFQANAALPITHFPSHLKSLASLFENVYLDVPASSIPRGYRSRPKSIYKYLNNSIPARSDYDALVEALNANKRKPLAPEIGKLRAIKSTFEQRIMRSAADISGMAHAKVGIFRWLLVGELTLVQTMRFTRPGLSEAALAAHFEYLCSLSGSKQLAYVPVVASGCVFESVYHKAY